MLCQRYRRGCAAHLIFYGSEWAPQAKCGMSCERGGAASFRNARRAKAAAARAHRPRKKFLRTASSAFLDNYGRLRRASPLCVKSCRLRGAAQLWPGAAALEKSCVKKPGRPDGLPGFLRACIRRQSRQANPAASCGGAPKRGLCLKTAPPLPSLKKAALCGDTLIFPCAPGRIVRPPGSAGGLRKPRRGILPASLSGGTECSAFCIACPPPANGVLPAVCCIF